MNTESSYPDQLLGCLETLSSGDAQLKYETDVPGIYVPHEIICQFFDDFYHPKTPEFLSAFTEEEIKEIGIFSGYLDIAANAVDSQDHPSVSEVLKMPQWREMMKKAGTLFEAIRNKG